MKFPETKRAGLTHDFEQQNLFALGNLQGHPQIEFAQSQRRSQLYHFHLRLASDI